MKMCCPYCKGKVKVVTKLTKGFWDIKCRNRNCKFMAKLSGKPG